MYMYVSKGYTSFISLDVENKHFLQYLYFKQGALIYNIILQKSLLEAFCWLEFQPIMLDHTYTHLH